jgi:VWFA-related protein
MKGIGMNQRCIFALILGMAAAGARAQTGTIIQTEKRIVLVDVTVTDKKGNSVSGLMQKDFRVWEDGKEQVISNFSSEADPTAKADSQNRYLVLFFDDTTMGLHDRARVREAAAGLIQANSGSNGLIALVNFSGGVQIVQNFTADTARLKDAIGSMNFASTGAPTFAPGAVALTSRSPTFALGPVALTSSASTFATRDLVLALRSLAGNMNAIPGRKGLVLFTGGFPATTTLLPELTAALDVCNRSNVAVYPVDLRGLEGPSSAATGRRNAADVASNSVALSSPVDDQFTAARSTWAGRAAAQSSKNNSILTNRQIMDMLADGTGGSVITSASDPVAGLARITKDQSEYYVLGYTPPPNQEKNCHSLRVKLERSGFLVRARAGYCDARTSDPLAGKPIEKELETRLSGVQSGTWKASMQAPFFYVSPNLARVNLALDMETAPLQFEKQKGKMHAAVNLLGMAYTRDGSVVARFSDTVDVDLPDSKEIEKFQRKPLHYETEFEITAGTYDLKLAFTAGAEAFGRLELPLAVGPYESNQFSISSLALSKEVRRTNEAGAQIEASLLQDKTLLIAKDLQVLPSGFNVFLQGEPAMFYFEIYEPRLVADSEKPAVAIEIRVLDRQTGAQRSDSGLMRLDVSGNAGNPVIPVALKMPVQSLAPGSYVLELTAADTANQIARRTADFEMK